MRLSSTGLEFLTGLEGIRLFAYLDTGGQATIGVGHALTQSERLSGKIWLGDFAKKFNEGLTSAQVFVLLDQDLEAVESAVNGSVTISITQGQYDTLVCWVFNVGIEAFRNSTLLSRLNAGKIKEVPTQLRRWVHDNGSIVAGLVNRRKKEIAFWLS